MKGCKNVYESFDKYVEIEKMEGENKYQANNHGLQDAQKGVLFIDFPPVLQLQLKRFEYDFMRDCMVKVGLAVIAMFSACCNYGSQRKSLADSYCFQDLHLCFSFGNVGLICRSALCPFRRLHDVF